MKITMKDIAKEAGVSIATVSHVINGTKRISKETQQLVWDAIKKFNYTPNLVAKNLRRQQTKTAALVVSSFPDSYVTGMVNGVGNRAREMGYNLLFVNTNEDPQYELDTIQLLNSNLVDGIILSPTSNQIEHLVSIVNQNVPLVLVNRYDPTFTDIPWVTADDFEAGYEATSHLIQHGHRHIGVIYAKPNISTTINRIEGYKKALEEHGIPFNSDYLELGHATVHGGINAVTTLLQRERQITSLFVLSDLMTIGTITALRNLSLSCPDDIAVIGYGDFASATIIDPPITNVNLPPDTIGKTAFDVLLNRMNNPDYVKHIQLPTSLIIRKSCGC